MDSCYQWTFNSMVDKVWFKTIFSKIIFSKRPALDIFHDKNMMRRIDHFFYTVLSLPYRW